MKFVKLERKIACRALLLAVSRKAVPALACAALLLLANGCGGLNGSYSVSPASFFLPGLLKAKPVQEQSPAITNLPPLVDPVEFLAKAQ